MNGKTCNANSGIFHANGKSCQVNNTILNSCELSFSRVLLASVDAIDSKERSFWMTTRIECRNENVFLKIKVTLRKSNSLLQDYKVYFNRSLKSRGIILNVANNTHTVRNNCIYIIWSHLHKRYFKLNTKYY